MIIARTCLPEPVIVSLRTEAIAILRRELHPPYLDVYGEEQSEALPSTASAHAVFMRAPDSDPSSRLSVTAMRIIVVDIQLLPTLLRFLSGPQLCGWNDFYHGDHVNVLKLDSSHRGSVKNI